jgi:hypothetical protein
MLSYIPGPSSFTERGLADMKPRRLAKSASRSVFGAMNEFEEPPSIYANVDSETELFALSMRLAQTPCDRDGLSRATVR